MRPTDRIPGFAICARCGARHHLGSCRACGLLLCSDCRGPTECGLCRADRLRLAARQRRRDRLRYLGRRAAVIGLVASAGAAGMGLALLPDVALNLGERPAALELRMATEPPMIAPARVLSVTQVREPAVWGEPLAIRCSAGSDDVVTCVVIDSPRR